VIEGFTGSCMFVETSNLSSFGFIISFLDYDVSMHGFVENVVVNPMSLRSSKMEPGCSS
jgi:hypothetical protein